MASVREEEGELVICLTHAENREVYLESNRLTAAHYRDGMTRDYCDAQWAEFMKRLFGAAAWRRFLDRKVRSVEIVDLDRERA